MKVKICGITNVEDALNAAACGADALGFVFYPRSPRSVNPKTVARIVRELPPFVLTVGVFVNETTDVVNTIVRDCGLDRAQLHGTEGPAYCDKIDAKVIKAFRITDASDIGHMKDYRVGACLLDTFSEKAAGGTGAVFNWNIAAAARGLGNIILSGGLKPENVQDAVRLVRPYAVDVSSGVEAGPGKKDPEKVRLFIEKARNAG